MMNNEIKMPANFAAIDENEMVYLQGGATTEATAWDVFLNVGKLSTTSPACSPQAAPSSTTSMLS